MEYSSIEDPASLVCFKRYPYTTSDYPNASLELTQFRDAYTAVFRCFEALCPFSLFPIPLREFLKDLSAIREQRMVSFEEIRAATKVHLHIISQFEEDGLVDHPLFNELYLRAFVRGYAKTLGHFTGSGGALLRASSVGRLSARIGGELSWGLPRNPKWRSNLRLNV